MAIEELKNLSDQEKSENSQEDSLDSGIDDSDKVVENKTSSRSSASKSKQSEPEDPYMKKKKMFLTFAIVAGIMVTLGIGTGYGIVAFTSPNSNSSNADVEILDGQEIEQVAGDNVSKGDIFGSADEETFKDSAEGYLEDGGVGSEGSHKLLRIGGESQTVALTSSVTDLDKLVGMEVKVWGETNKAKEAGWLMDVGRVEVLNTEGEIPTE